MCKKKKKKKKKNDKVVQLVGGESVINRATPSSFTRKRPRGPLRHRKSRVVFLTMITNQGGST